MDTQDIRNALGTDGFDAGATHAHDSNGAVDPARRATQAGSRASVPVQEPILEPHVESARYARCVEASKRIRWDIDRDVIRHREFDFTKKFLPDGLSFVDRLPFLSGDERRLLSQVQGRSYANIFGLVERFIGAKMLEVSRDHWLGDQIALEALVRFTDEELKHQELFRRIEKMIGSRNGRGLLASCRSRTTSRRPCSASLRGRCSR